jgi:5-methylcytosine-specific restriction endonuclease McrA
MLSCCYLFIKEFMKKLTFELIPRTCFYSNVRSNVSAKEWNIIKKHRSSIAKHVCEICGDSGINQGRKWPVECHEVWEYTYGTKNIQKLTSFISLCPKCHEVKHIGLAEIRGRKDVALDHYCKVNKVKLREAQNSLADAKIEWKERSAVEWQLDLSYMITEFNITPS